MLKNLLLISAFAYSLNANAQNITVNDLPNLGDVVIEYIDTVNVSQFTVTPSGIGQVWNYENAFTISDTGGFYCLPLSTIPWNASAGFQNSEFGVYDLQDSAAAFYSSNTNGLFLDGYFDLNSEFFGETSIPFTNSRIIIPTPFSMGNTRNHQSHYQVEGNYQIDSVTNALVRLRSYHIQQFTAESTGSLSTPAGTYSSALRVKEIDYTIDSSWVDLLSNGNWILADVSGPQDTTIYYKWFANGLPCIRMQLEIDENTNNIKSASFFDSDFVLTNIKENDNGFRVFPNPTNSLINITDVAKQIIRMVNMLGETVLETRSLNSNFSYDMSELTKGVYFIEVTNAEGLKTIKKVIKN
jgi:hypothetical protein